MNSFLFLDSVKKIVEHRQIKSRPTVLMGDFKLMASKEKNAPTTLLRLILADGPLSEKEIAKKILKLAIYSSCTSTHDRCYTVLFSLRLFLQMRFMRLIVFTTITDTAGF